MTSSTHRRAVPASVPAPSESGRLGIDGGAATLPAADAASADPRPVTSAPPRVVVGRGEEYELGELVAQGGMGMIIAARGRRLGRSVALKLPRMGVPGVLARFEREAALTARLQHPSIVPVYEVGDTETGLPFYAMKLVTGSPLNQVIERAGSLQARLALLPRVVAIAEAVAYAHEQGVIHRDLKPHNVLAGDHGETVVFDWGIAKQRGVPELDAAAVDASPMVATERTAVGQVLGTPAYMPPEQARGEPVDERADVYALGAILYHVLSGRAPFAGQSTAEICARLERDEGPPPLADRAIPAELVQVVARAMAPRAQDRPARAAEVAALLADYLAGRLLDGVRYTRRERARRFARRHPAVVVGAAAALVLAGVGAVAVARVVESRRDAERARAIAEAARAESERRRGDAEELMDFMLGDLRERLEPLNRVALLEAVASKARGYYAARPADVAVADRRRRAQALRNVGDVLRAQGDLPGALAQYRDALALAEALSADSPDDRAAARALGAAHGKLGEVLEAQGDAPGALARYRAAQAIAERLVAADPRDAAAQADLAAAHDLVGAALDARGDRPGALAAHRAAEAIRERLAAAPAADAAARRALLVSRKNVGDALRLAGDTPGALAAYRAALAIDARLAADDPANARWQRNLSVSHNQVGDLLQDRRDPDGALAAYRAALAIRERLAASDPSNAGWQRDVSVSQERIGFVLEDRGDLAGALAAYRAALATAERLAATDPGNAGWQRDLSVSHQKVGDVLLARGDVAGAEPSYRAALAIRERLAAADPGNARGQRDLSTIRLKLGDMLRARRDAAGAAEAYRAALAIRERLAAADPANARTRRDVAVAGTKLGTALEDQGDAAGAEAAYAGALAILEALAASDPTNAQWRDDVARQRETLARCCRVRR